MDHRNETPRPPIHFVPFDPNELFDAIILDPLLGTSDTQDRVAEFKNLGFSGPITRSELYQGTLFVINV